MNVGKKPNNRQLKVVGRENINFEKPLAHGNRDPSFGPPVAEIHNFSVVDYHDSSNMVS
jgi:hypothetical protein